MFIVLQVKAHLLFPRNQISGKVRPVFKNNSKRNEKKKKRQEDSSKEKKMREVKSLVGGLIITTNMKL